MGNEESRESGSNRRAFLRSLAATGAAGVVGTGAASGDSNAAADAYHEALRAELTGEEGLPAGEFVYGDTERAKADAFELSGGDGGTETEIAVEADVPITIADRLEIGTDPANAYDFTYTGGDSGASLETGDVLLAVASLRGPEAASSGSPIETQCEFKFEYADPDGNTSYSQSFVQATPNVTLGSSWRRYYFPIEVTEIPDGTDLRPYLEFWMGFGEQTVDVGGVALIDYGQEVAVGDLPTNTLDYEYPGRAEDAEWRSAARERIEETRKTDFELTVTDSDGNPAKGAAVDVTMREHEFGFGTAVGVNRLPDGSATYREKLLENFNKAVPENGLKVPAWEGRFGESLGPESTRAALNWLDDEGVPTRGHALVWSTYDWMGVDPDQSDEAIHDQVVAKIEERASEFSHLPEWDVHNHPLFYPEIWRDIGRENVLDWWETANDAAPDSRMYVNEMNIIAGESLRRDYYDHVQWLRDNDAGVGGIGFMAHFGLGELTPPEELLSRFDQFAEFGVPLQLTEFDVQINDRSEDNEVAVQRDYVRDALTAAFSHEAVEGVMSWGFWADEHWRPTAAYYDSDWTLRPHGEEYRRLVFEEWWTETGGETDADGVFADRGFEGTYDVVARTGDELGRATVEFTDDGATAEVQLAPASVADVDLDVSQRVLFDGETVDIGVELTGDDGTDLPVPAEAVAYESADKDVLLVDDDGVVSVAGTGAATVTVTVPAYGDTAVASAQFAAFGEPTVSDDAADLSVAAGSENLSAVGYAARHGDDTRFEKNAADEPGRVTYEVPDGLSAFRAVAYVNYQDSSSDAFEDVEFAVSADGDTWDPVDVERTVSEEAGDSNGYFGLWTYLQTGGIPDDATRLRVTVPENTATWATSIGSVEIWGSSVETDVADSTGPAVVVDDLQSGRTYEAPREAGVSIADDGSSVAERTVALNGDDWEGGGIVSRGRNLLSVSASNPDGVTTAAELDFEVTRADESLNARLQPSATQGAVGERLEFQVIDTTGDDGHVDSLEWDFDDGTAAAGYWNAHRFDEPGVYTVELTATDSDGEATTDELVVRIAELGGVLAEARPSATDAAVDERITFGVEDTSGRNRWITDLAWEFGDGETAGGWWTEHRYDEAGAYTVVLTATDNLGYSTDHEVEISVS